MMNEPPSFTLSRSFYPKMFTKNVNGIKCHCTLNTFEKHKKCQVLNINENQLYNSYKIELLYTSSSNCQLCNHTNKT